MATFYNQATLIFDGSSTSSNITEGEIEIGLNGLKTALSSDYWKKDGVSYAVSITNSGSLTESNISVEDDLGSFTPAGMTSAVTPLEYVDGSVLFYINGVLSVAPTVTTGADSVTFSNITLPAGANALLIYEARVNEYASLELGSIITNNVTITGNTGAETLTDSSTVPVRSETSLTIAKAVCPSVITDSGDITYTFIIQNTGNTAAIATDNVIVNDTFTPILNPITVTINGSTAEEGVAYDYNETTGEFTTLTGAITVPAATFTRNAETGIVSTVPGVSIITVTGTI